MHSISPCDNAILSAFLLLASATVSAAPDALIASWVQYTADGVGVRAVTVAPKCPSVTIDGRSSVMSERAGPDSSHPDRVCSATVPMGAREIELEGERLPVPPATTPTRIVVMGDSGCRVSDSHGFYQACNNSSEWPFARVAESAAAAKPEAIVYTGDYIYRESACPAGNNGCAGTPWGDNQPTWIADWFGPSRPVRLAAPLVLIRGNHENCSRAGLGWFRYLDAHPFDGKCLRTADAWVANLGELSVAVLDSNELKDVESKPLTALFAKQIEALGQSLEGPVWIATHRPVWGFEADDDSGQPVLLIKVLQDAVRRGGLPTDTRLIVGAHLHLAEIVGFDGIRPPQLVVGNGGTQLIPETPPPEEIDGKAVVTQRAFYQYGFATMDAVPAGGWTVRFRDRDGRDMEQCRITDKSVVCEK